MLGDDRSKPVPAESFVDGFVDLGEPAVNRRDSGR